MKIKKYKHPIPSREFILEYLAKCENYANCKEIATQFKVYSNDRIEALYRRLRAMERDGQLIFTKEQNYVLPKRVPLLKGIVIGHRDGYGFLRVKGRKDDLYLSYEQMKYCIHGDQVLAHIFKSNCKGRCEARIVRILGSKNNQIIGRYFIDSGIRFVIPNDHRLNFNILIPEEGVMGARIGFMVVVELTQRLTRHTRAVGKIIEILSDNISTNIAVVMALKTNKIPYIWPKDVEKQIANLKEKVPEIAKVDRVDLRNLPLITIDSENAHDFDDAVYCEKKRSGGWRLWVAISDVSYYVRPYTPLDNEARNRGTSIYFPSQAIPMLPEILSNELCSLNPQVDRLCIVCEMVISSHGLLSNYQFYEAVINSHARLSYTKVWHILQGDLKLSKEYSSLVKHIQELYNLYKILERARENRGGIFIENEGTQFVFDSEYRIKCIKQMQRNDAHKLVEECMILANISAAYFVEKEKEPALFRTHDKPTDEAIVVLRSMLNKLGLELSGGSCPETRDYAKLLTFIASRPDAEMLQAMLMRSMKQAIYDSENRGHFGLALQSYAHFTSPIRRYPDLLLHRIIKYLIAHKKYGLNKNTVKTGGYSYSIEEIHYLGKHCSITERRADSAAREVVDWLKCDFMSHQVGNIFKAMISNITNFGFFVRLNKWFIDGLVHISTLNNDHYYFDEKKQRLIGKFGRKNYSLGDYVMVRVKSVNMDERKIYFTLTSTKYLLCSSERTIHRNSLYRS